MFKRKRRFRIKKEPNVFIKTLKGNFLKILLFTIAFLMIISIAWEFLRNPDDTSVETINKKTLENYSEDLKSSCFFGFQLVLSSPLGLSKKPSNINLEVACPKFSTNIINKIKKKKTYFISLLFLNLNIKKEKNTGPIISDKAPIFFGKIIHVGIILHPFDICLKYELIESYKLKFNGNDEVK